MAKKGKPMKSEWLRNDKKEKQRTHEGQENLARRRRSEQTRMSTPLEPPCGPDPKDDPYAQPG